MKSKKILNRKHTKSAEKRHVPVPTLPEETQGRRQGSAYDDQSKQDTREIWYGKYLRDEKKGGIVMLAGDTPHEVHTAMRHGFHLERITPVDHNFDKLKQFVSRFSGAEREHIRRAARHSDVSEVCQELALNGDYQRVLSLDFCGYAEAYEVRAVIQRCLNSDVLMHGGKLVVEVLDGRENEMLERFGEHVKDVSVEEESKLWRLSPYIRKPMTPHEVVRLKLLRTATFAYRGRVVPIGIGKYQNGPSPMLWVIYSLTPKSVSVTLGQRKGKGDKR